MKCMSLSENGLRTALADFSLMKFFPGDEDTRAAIMKALTLICATDSQLELLVRKYVLCYPEWEGVHELRACAVSIFRPLDGFEGRTSTRYPDGVPSIAELRDPTLAAIPAAARRLDLPPSQQKTVYKQLVAAKESAAPYTADPELELLVRECADVAKVEPRKAHTVEEISEMLYNKRK